MSGDDYAGPGVPSFGPRWCYCAQGRDRDLVDLRWGHQYGPQCTPAPVTEQQAAEIEYPEHAPPTALLNFRAGRQVWDTNGDLW